YIDHHLRPDSFLMKIQPFLFFLHFSTTPTLQPVCRANGLPAIRAADGRQFLYCFFIPLYTAAQNLFRTCTVQS
ncbi:MAG: hypothetical protein K2O83_03365, partial [Schaedlerella arabinosiphila]|nr:hypothetical protein [Schaedlerella arabinosiphila]